MAQIELIEVTSHAKEFIPHTEELFQKYQEALEKFPELEEHCDIEYWEPDGEPQEDDGLRVRWAGDAGGIHSDSPIYYTSVDIDLSKNGSASLGELQCLHELIGNYSFS